MKAQIQANISQGKERSLFTLLAALKNCSKNGDLETGKALHVDAVEAACHTNRYLATALITMYGKCRSMLHARALFDNMEYWDAVVWNSLLLGYVENGENSLALDMFTRMVCAPVSLTYVAACKACIGLASEKNIDTQFCLEKGMAIHRQLEEDGYDRDILVASSLVDMYRRCGSMVLAREVFDKMMYWDVVSWTSLILGYVENGESLLAIELFMNMGCEGNAVTYVAALKACAGLVNEKQFSKQLCLEKGMGVHTLAKERGYVTDMFVASTLVDMYSKCGSMVQAKDVFDSTLRRDVVTWNSLMLGYVENGESFVAMDLFRKMDCKPDYVTFVAAVKACANMAAERRLDKHSCLEKGIAIHTEARECRYDVETVVANSLIDMYSKCGSMVRARNVFDGMIRQSTISWNSLILGYVENGEGLVALDLFASMDCEPECITYAAALKACASLASHSRGMEIHRELVSQRGFDRDIILASTLVDMYSKCGDMLNARAVFDNMVCWDVVCWNSLIMGYVGNGEGLLAVELFTSMNCEPDYATFVSVTRACSGAVSLERAILIHERARACGVDGQVTVASALIEMYSGYGCLQEAQSVFEGVSHRDVILWTNLIQGYVENGESLQAMDLYSSMEFEPDCLTFLAVLKACGSLAALADGQRVHSRICKMGIEQEQPVANSLLDFYWKCGKRVCAERVFNTMCVRDIVSWNSLISGYSLLGDTSEVYRLITSVRELSFEISPITCLHLLTACNHGGMVEEGIKSFKLMLINGISLSMEHYACVVDMLGRANRLEEALQVIKSMPYEADGVAWTSLLGACKKFNNVEIGKVAFDALVAFKDLNTPAYVLMGDIYKS